MERKPLIMKVSDTSFGECTNTGEIHYDLGSWWVLLVFSKVVFSDPGLNVLYQLR